MNELPTTAPQMLDFVRTLSVSGVFAIVIWALVRFVQSIQKGQWYPKHAYDELRADRDKWVGRAEKGDELNERLTVAIERLAERAGWKGQP